MKKRKTNYTLLFIKTVVTFIAVETFLGMMAITIIDKLFF